jgi:hypothetical protein
VLTDFGCEQSFARAAQSVKEHYGFEIGASAVRTETLEHAQRAQETLQKKYEQSFRILPPVNWPPFTTMLASSTKLWRHAGAQVSPSTPSRGFVSRKLFFDGNPTSGPCLLWIRLMLRHV